jgi:hypothetical protein
VKQTVALKDNRKFTTQINRKFNNISSADEDNKYDSRGFI